ncbi:MAG TPA: alpha-L-fucosidase, partial [Gemmatimonadales bacterium]|nr:alpha-L-fucosidase [Gemmatimonadales bacterium]
MSAPRIPRRAFLESGAALLGALAVGPYRPSLFRPLSVAPDMGWWREARFGLFIHWGLYSILGGAWGGRTDYAEWIRNNAHIPLREYDKLVAR